MWRDRGLIFIYLPGCRHNRIYPPNRLPYSCLLSTKGPPIVLFCSKAITSPLNSSTDFCHGRSTDSRNHRKYSPSDLPTKSPWSMCISLPKDMYLRRWEANSSFFLNANTCEHQKCICPLINIKRCFDFEVCCRLITPGETEMVTGCFSWCDNKHLLSIYLFDRIFYFILIEINAPRGIPSGSVQTLY